jgi:hypothetical protein
MREKDIFEHIKRGISLDFKNVFDIFFRWFRDTNQSKLLFRVENFILFISGGGFMMLFISLFSNNLL